MKLRAALGFFTRLPIGSAPLPPTFQGVAAWLPAVGIIVGALAALCVGLAALVLPPPLCGALGCLAWVVPHGRLHLD
uniref:adenosylcobinamide-GDP ribazoletransferase n=1 Tax=uncultured Bilophila sp. TaxID=529385 RepID=UPI002626966B